MRPLVRILVAIVIACMVLVPVLPPEHAHKDEAHHTRVVHRHFESHDRPGRAHARASAEGTIVWLSPVDADVNWLIQTGDPQLQPRAVSAAALVVLCGLVPPSITVAVSADATPPPHGPPRSGSPSASSLLSV